MAEPVHNEEDAEEQGMMNGKEKVNFRIGTPLSDCMAGFSGEHSSKHPSVQSNVRIDDAS